MRFFRPVPDRDKKLKRDLYERVDLKEYWVVDPEQDQVEIYRRSDNSFGEPISVPRSGVVRTPLLPDFELQLERVFAAQQGQGQGYPPSLA